jgi:hypothetical protein
MGFKGFKSIKKAFKNPVKVVTDAFDDAVSDVGGAIDDAANDVSDAWSDIEDEVNRWSDDLEAIWKTLTGEMAEDRADLQREYDALKAFATEYERLAKEMETEYEVDMQSLYFLPSIFSIASSHRYEDKVLELQETKGSEYERMKASFEASQKRFNDDYSFVLDLAGSNIIGQLVASAMMIIGGLIRDISAVFRGDASAKQSMNVITTIIKIIVIVALFMSGGGSWAGMSMAAQTAAALAIADLVISLDATYADSTLLGGIFSILDFMFNDILDADDKWGSDWEDFDSDSEGYQQLMVKFRTSLAIASTIASFNAASALETGFSEMASQIGLAGNTAGATGTMFQTYQLYQQAMAIGDVVEARKEYSRLKAKLETLKNNTDESINKQLRNKMMAAYKDSAYIQTDSDEIINGWILTFSSNPLSPFDPASTIPMNSRYKYNSESMLDTNFGGVFDYDRYGGSDDYTKNIVIRNAFGIDM